MRFIDTNIFLRYLTGDDEEKRKACLALFQRIQRGEEEGVTRETHIHETVYIMASPALYHLSHAEIRDRLAPVLSLRGLKLNDKRLCLEALNIFASYDNLDFADALAVAYMTREGIQAVYSYDRDFDRIPGTNRLEP